MPATVLSTSGILTDFILITVPVLSTTELRKLGYRHSQWLVDGGAGFRSRQSGFRTYAPTLPFRFSERNELTDFLFTWRAWGAEMRR